MRTAGATARVAPHEVVAGARDALTQSPGVGGATNKNLVLTAMVFAVAMTFIDQTIVAIAIPDIQKNLSLSATGTQWVVNGYLLALSALFAFGGRLADIAGRRRMVTIGVAGFAVTSACCGFTPTGSVAETVDRDLPRAPGRLCGAHVPGGGGDRRGDVPFARAGPRDVDLLRHRRRAHRDRADRGRLPHAVDVALDLLDQHPGGDRRARADPDLASRRRAPAGPARPPRDGARHLRDGAHGARPCSSRARGGGAALRRGAACSSASR